MTPLTSVNINSTRHSTVFFILLVIAGLTGNYFNYPIFLNLDFLFGSIFAMLVLQFFGYGPAILAAAIISSYTYILWNHPYGIVIMSAEMVFVGWLSGRRKVSLVFADTVYWFVLGMPMVYLFYHIVMQVPPSSAGIVMTKQAINGITAALSARLIFSGYALRTRTSLISYREIVYNLLAFFVLCPALIMLAVESRSDFIETDRQIRSSLIQDSKLASQRLEAWVENRKTAVVCLAELAASLPPRQMQARLEQAKRSDANFVRIGLQGRDAISTAFFPPLDELGRSNIGKSFADRPYIPILRQTLKPMLSEVMMGRIGVPGPVVALVAPVVIDGGYGGFVGAILSLEKIREYLDKSTSLPATLYTLLDKNGRVIMTNRGDQKIMSNFVRGNGEFKLLGNGNSRWLPAALPHTPNSERWTKSFYVTESGIGGPAEWKLVMEQPVAPFHIMFYEQYSNKLYLLFAILLITMLIAEFLSRRIMMSIGQLQKFAHELPVRILENEELLCPESAILEANNLIEDFKHISDLLSAQHSVTRHFNESLEQQIEERTRQVNQLAREQQIILSTLSVGVSLIKDRSVFWTNPAHDRILGYKEGRTKGMNTSSFYSDRQKFEQVGIEGDLIISSRGIYSTDAEMKREDGSLVWCHITGCALNAGSPADGSIWVLQDISERKIAELAVRESEERYRALIGQAYEGIFVMSSSNMLVDVNESFARMHGYTVQEMLGMNLTDFDKMAFSEKNSERSARLIAGETLTFEAEHTHKDGHIIPLEVSTSLIVSGGESYFLAFHRDITERKRAEEELCHAKETAEAANEAKSRFLATVAHEFRTPLSLLLSSSDILKNYEEHLTPEDRAEQIGNIQSAAHQMADLIDTVISFNRAGASMHLDFTPLDIGRISSAIAGEVKTVWCTGQQFHVAIDAGCGIVMLNEILFRRVMENLLSNAFRYTLPDGTVSLAISRKESRLLLDVTDTGIGIPAEDRSRIFEAFYRGRNVDKQRGLGLGLSIVSEALAKLGGSIMLNSALDEGTAMRVEIPVTDAATTEDLS